ncbi:MAG TPA: hypothetical protein VM120_04110, partial [Bryobacteraceae bacterium]|nr:hypothetical protein [Bryobacteraceae bacterium]
MNRLYALYLALITAASAQTTEKPSPADSQQTATHRTYNVKPGPFLREFGHDEIDLWTSPFKRRNYSGHAFKKYVIPFALITGALIASDRQTADLLPNTTDQVIWSSRVSQVGAGYSLAG